MAGHGNPLAVSRSAPKPLKYFVMAGKNWVPSAMTYGAFAGAMFLYFTDWKLFMDKVPFYRTKFEEKEPLV